MNLSLWALQVENALLSLQWLFLSYFVLLNCSYIVLNVLSMMALRRYLDRHGLDRLPHAYTGFDLPISILVPAYNEEATIAASIRWPTT